MKKIAIIGLGYVGLPLAVEFGKVRETVGFDINNNRVEELKNSYDRTKETSAEDLSSASFLDYTNNISDIFDASIYIVTVPTPIDSAKRPVLTPLSEACKMIGTILCKNDLVIFESTVFPGATEEICIPILERQSELIFNKEFFCGYSPERINPGDKINTLTKIKKITSGSNPEIAQEINDLYSSIIVAGTHLAPSIKVAEAAKVIENTQRDLNIAFVNELSVIFERLNIDTLEVLEAAGSKWNFLPFRPGMVGGHCIGVDPYYLTHKAEQVGYNPQVILSGRRINDNMAKYAARAVVKKMVNLGLNVSKSKVGVLGVTFKENCPDIRNSKVFDLLEELVSWGIEVIALDPWASQEDVASEYDIELTKNYPEKEIDAIIVAVGHKEFRALSPMNLKKMCVDHPKIVLGDIKALYNRSKLIECGFDVFRL